MSPAQYFLHKREVDQLLMKKQREYHSAPQSGQRILAKPHFGLPQSRYFSDLLLNMMEYKSAIVNYLKALAQNPQQQEIRKKIVYAYFQLKKIDDAYKYLKEEMVLYPNNSDAYGFWEIIT